MVLDHIFAFNTAAVLLGMASFKFLTVTIRALYHFLRTSSSCFRDVAGGKLLLRIVSKADQNGSMMFKCGDCAGQETC
jgi:hypothetical protein